MHLLPGDWAGWSGTINEEYFMTEQKTVINLKGIVKRFYVGMPNELEILHGVDLQVRE